MYVGVLLGVFFQHSQFCDQSRGSNIKINTQMIISGFFLKYPCIFLIILIVNIFFEFSPNTFDSLVIQAAWEKTSKTYTMSTLFKEGRFDLSQNYIRNNKKLQRQMKNDGLHNYQFLAVSLSSRINWILKTLFFSCTEAQLLKHSRSSFSLNHYPKWHCCF